MFLSQNDSITAEQFSMLFAELHHDFPVLWKMAIRNWENEGEYQCSNISGAIARWFASRGVTVGCVWGSYDFFPSDGYNNQHMFVVIYIDNEEWIIDGSARQFTRNKKRLQVIRPCDTNYNRYLKMVLFANESISYVQMYDPCAKSYQLGLNFLARKPLVNTEQLMAWNAESWMFETVLECASSYRKYDYMFRR